MTNNEVSKIHVLLVEDELSHVEIIRRSLEKSDEITISVANSIKAARDFLSKTHPDIIVMDLNLPDGQGIELLPENKAELDYPIILMTCNGNEQVAVEAMKAGVMDYIVKSPESLKNIPARVHRVLQEWAHHTERKWEEDDLRLTNEQLRICERAIREREGRQESDQTKKVPNMDQVTHIVSSVKDEIAKTLAIAPKPSSLGIPTTDQSKRNDVGHSKKEASHRLNKQDNRRQDTRHYYDNIPVLWRNNANYPWQQAQLHDISLTGLGLIAPYGHQPEVGNEIEIISQDTRQQIFCKVIRSKAWHEKNVFVGIRIETHIYHDATLEPTPKILTEHQTPMAPNRNIDRAKSNYGANIDTREPEVPVSC